MPDLESQRASAPIGSIVSGTVTWIPNPGLIGVGVDLDLPTRGFVDVLDLPTNPLEWPFVGQRFTFEIIQHRRGQIRLRTADPTLRRAPDRLRYSPAAWDEIKRRYPVGSTVVMTVERTFTSNQKCRIDDGFLNETAEWSGPARPKVLVRATGSSGTSTRCTGSSLRQPWL